LSISAKLFIQTFLILLIVLVSSGYVYIKSIDAVFENQIYKDINHDTIQLKNYIQNIENNIETLATKIVKDENIQASINLISKYEDSQNYRAITFDNEKRQLLSTTEKFIGSSSDLSVSYFDSTGALIARKGKRDDNYISWQNGTALLVGSSGIEPIVNLPMVNTTTTDQIIAYYKDQSYLFKIVKEIKTAKEVIGYVQVGYKLGINDIEQLLQNLINGLFFELIAMRR